MQLARKFPTLKSFNYLDVWKPEELKSNRFSWVSQLDFLPVESVSKEIATRKKSK